MTESAAATLEYGRTASRHGVIYDERDDGVTITLPGNLSSAVRGSEHMLIALAATIIWVVGRMLKKPQPPRMIIELNRTEFRISEKTGRGSAKMTVQSWPRVEVGELRPNRYSRGLLVRIPGKQNFDILTDCSSDLIQSIGQALTEALERTKPDSPAS